MKDTIAIVTDMQRFFLKRFPLSVLNELINNQEKVIDFCIKNKIPFILLEYKTNHIIKGNTIERIESRVNKNLLEKIKKENNSGFVNTCLDTTLKKLNTKKIILLGVNANGCVQDTAISAIHRGYKVITSQGIIASTSRKDLSFSKNNRDWFKKNTIFLEDPDSLVKYLK